MVYENGFWFTKELNELQAPFKISLSVGDYVQLYYDHPSQYAEILSNPELSHPYPDEIELWKYAKVYSSQLVHGEERYIHIDDIFDQIDMAEFQELKEKKWREWRLI
tara:strand:+ start:563 stop:883 length:321 start_codon:yes stop_codon:yes gene_type:complete